ncbi:hypothetical protein SAMN05444392_101802 [Seinonella peptonophila]|uniref:GIY-YIG domain-containing protein n=1 Tax=Seinonella peptonophila TaxID=112248 RepID=A0A1M4U4P4_9BACL|nr:hypothetical protein [Seinonella peptonophila]SHE51517.1 hypothetical protein SAMN05444392_101802 [Seinonella peptonophila]
MMKRLKQLLRAKKSSTSPWATGTRIDWNCLEFYAPFEYEEEIYALKLKDIILDTYTNKEYQAVDMIRKNSRWGEESDFFIMQALDTDDQFALEHSIYGFEGNRYQKKYQFSIPDQYLKGYIDLENLFTPSVRAEIRKLTLPQQPGIYFFYDENHRLLYVNHAPSIRDRVYAHIATETRQDTFMIRQQFSLLSYMIWENEAERQAIAYFCRQQMQPEFPEGVEIASSFDSDYSVLKLDIRLRDLQKYIHIKNNDFNHQEWKRFDSYLRTIPEEMVQQIEHQVVAMLYEEMQKQIKSS